MNSLFEYRVNNVVMDLFPNTATPKLRRIAEELNDPTKRGLDSSFKMSIPKTAKNLNALGITTASGAYGLFQVPQNESLLSFQSITILQGITEVDTITDRDIQVVIYSRYLNFVDAVKERTLQDLTTFGQSPWYYEDTIRNHVNRNYSYDDMINPVHMLNTGDMVNSGFNWTYNATSVSWNFSGIGETKAIRVPFPAQKSTNYTFRYTLSDVTLTGGPASIVFMIMNNNLETYSFGVTITAGMTTGTVNLATAGILCNHFGVKVTSISGSTTGTILNIEQVTPTPTEEVNYQFPFVMNSRYYTPRKTIDAWFKEFISGSGSSARYTRGSATSNGQDYQVGQFLILNDIQVGSGAGVAKYQDDGVDAETIPTFAPNYAEFGTFPAYLYVGKILKAICKEAGWEIGGSLLQNENFKRLIVGPTGSGEFWDSAIISNYDREEAANDLFEATRITSNQDASVQATGTPFISSEIGITWTPILFNFEDSDPNARYNPATGKYTFGVNYRATFTVTVEAYYQIFASVPNQTFAAWRLYSSIKGEIARSSYNVYSIFTATRTFTFVLQSSTLDFVAGEEVWVQMAAWGPIGVSGTIRTRIDSNFYNVIVGGSTELALLNPVAFLPKLKQLDFIKQFVLIPFNAFMYVNDQTKTIYLEAYENFVLPTSHAINISDQVINLTDIKEESIPIEDRSAKLIFAENDDDNVPFMPNQYKYPDDYSTMVRLRKKEVTVGGKIYKNNEIFNGQTGLKEIVSQLSPINYRKFTIIQTNEFDGSTFSTNYPLEIMLPVISNNDDMTLEWFNDTATGLDDRPFSSELSFGSGLRMLKYDGIGEWVNWLDNVPYDVYWLYLGDPGYHSTSGLGGENVRFKMKIGLTSFVGDQTYLIDDNYNEYFNTSFYSRIDSPLNLSASNLYKYSNADDPSEPIFGWQTNDNGTFTIVRDDLYTLHYAKKYEILQFSDILTVDIYMNENDWNRLQVNVPVIVNTVAYSVLEISNYEPTRGLATLKLLKKLN